MQRPGAYTTTRILFCNVIRHGLYTRVSFRLATIPSAPAAITITITVAIATTIVTAAAAAAAATVVVATLPRHLSWRAGFWIKCYIRKEPPGYY